MRYRVAFGIAMMLCLSLVSTNANAPSALEPQSWAHWQFNDGTGQVAADSGGRGFHATLGASSSADAQDPVWVPGLLGIGMALDFDGRDDRLSAGTGPNWFGTSQLTVSAWIQPDSLRRSWVIARARAEFPEVGDFGLRIQDGSGHVTPNVRTDNGWMEFTSTGTVPVGVWTHLAMVADYSGLKLYINGVQDPVTTGRPGPFSVLENPHETWIGAHPPRERESNPVWSNAPVAPFDGRIDEVEIWYDALSPSEIAEYYDWVNDGLPSDLLAHWRFDDGAGQVAADSSGNGFHAQLGVNAKADPSDPDWVAGFRGMALDFDGSGVHSANSYGRDWLDAGTRLGSSMTEQLTVSAWIRPDSLGKRDVVAKGLVGRPLVGDFGLRINDVSGHVSARVRTDHGWMEVISTAGVPVGAWTDLAMVADGGGLRLYINGDGWSVTPGIVGSFDATSNRHPTWIGRHPPDTQRASLAFNGLIDEVRIWNRALSASEIADDYSPTNALH